MQKKNNSAKAWLGEFYPVYFSFVGGKTGTEFYHYYKKDEPWVWEDCGLVFYKISDDIIKFVVRRHKCIELKYDPKTCGIKNGIANVSSKPSRYNMRYFIEFEVPLNKLSHTIKPAKKKLDNEKNSVEKDSWLVELDEHHHIWSQKTDGNIEDSVVYKISRAIEIKKNGNSISDTFSFANPIGDNNKLIPVICHPARDFNLKELEHKNFVREIHLYHNKSSNKIHATIVFTGERLRRHWFVYYLYKAFRLFAYGRTYDIESFNIIPQDKNKIKYDFPNIYSENNNIYADNIHKNRCAVDARFYLDSFNHPLLFVNTANHAMAEHDGNLSKWKVEYAPWENDCPVFLGQEKRCEIEKRLRVLTINPLLLISCNDCKYECCNGQ